MEIDKFGTAILTLKPDVDATWSGKILTEEDFEKVRWVTGVNENGAAISSTTCPHEELTWSSVSAEMNRLQAEYDAQEYARNRATAYASTGDQLDMQYWDSVNDTTTWKDHIASVKDQFPKV